MCQPMLMFDCPAVPSGLKPSRTHTIFLASRAFSTMVFPAPHPDSGEGPLTGSLEVISFPQPWAALRSERSLLKASWCAIHPSSLPLLLPTPERDQCFTQRGFWDSISPIGAHPTPRLMLLTPKSMIVRVHCIQHLPALSVFLWSATCLASPSSFDPNPFPSCHPICCSIR